MRRQKNQNYYVCMVWGGGQLRPRLIWCHTSSHIIQYTIYNTMTSRRFSRAARCYTPSAVGGGGSEGHFRQRSLHPLQNRKGPHDVKNRLWWHRLHLPTSDHPPSRSSARQHFNHNNNTSMIGKKLTAYRDRRDDTRLHVMQHRDQPPSDGKETFVAASYLPANCGTTTVDVADVLCSGSLHSSPPGTDDASSPMTGSKTALSVSVDDAGRLVCAAGGRCPAADCSCWILSVPLADDCQAYNCRLSLLAAGTVGLHTTVAVMPGQPLKMWFPPDLQLMLHVPFLTPVNIRDERKYVCHKCGYTCEKPNPLKIHMALDCGRRPRAKLWSRLAADHCASGRTIEASFRFSLTPAELRTPLSSTSADSAFRPYSPESSASSGGGQAPPSPLRPPPPAPPSSSSSSDRTPLQDGLLRQVIGGSDTAFFDRRCAEMETIVSNLGHSDQGHLCIYCGKVYSRKYGLKIHIRTHTGFKPLKCKYCYRPFGDPSNLNKHVRLHAEGDTPYKCDCCGKILVRKRDLDRHMKSRHAQVLQKNVYKMHVPV